MADVATEYAEALYILSAEEKLEPEILGDARQLAVVFGENPEIVSLLKNPTLPKSERKAVVDRIFGGKLHEYTLSTLKLLIDREHGAIMPSVMSEYVRLWYKYSGIAVAEVKSARPLDENQKQRLQSALERRLGRDVEMLLSVDEALMGGVSVTVDGHCFEDTVRGRIDGLRRSLDEIIL